MIRRRFRQHQAEKFAQRERIGGTPRNRALGIETFKVPDQEQAEVAARRQPRSACVRVESLAESLDVLIEIVSFKDLIQARVERMGGAARQILRGHSQRRLP